MKGMVDGRLLKRAWDENQLGELLLGCPPYDYEADLEEKVVEQARLTRLRQVTDFLRCRTARERQRVLYPTITVLERSGQKWAKVSALLLRHTFTGPEDDSPPTITP